MSSIHWPPMMRAKPRSGDVDWMSVGAFLALAFGLAWACWFVLRALGLPAVAVGSAGMFGPAIAALLVRYQHWDPHYPAGIPAKVPLSPTALIALGVVGAFTSGAIVNVFFAFGE